MKTFQQIATEVAESRKRIAAVDPDAYGGFITDEACRAVGRRNEMKSTDVVRAFRHYHPVSTRLIPRTARRPSAEAAAQA